MPVVYGGNKLNYNLPKTLNKRVTIRQEANTDDGMGGFTEGWSDIATVWAGIKPRSAKEFLEAEGLENTLSHTVTIRYRSDVRPDMQVVYDSRHFHITGVVNVEEANRYLQLMCEEEV